MDIGKLNLQQVKEEIAKISSKITAKTASKEEKRLFNNLNKKKNQLEKTISKEKRKGAPVERDFNMEFEIDEGCRSIIRNYLSEDLEIKKLEAEIDRRKNAFTKFKSMYHEVIDKYEQIPSGILEEQNKVKKKFDGLKKLISDDDDAKMGEYENLRKAGMKQFEIIKTIGKQNIDKYSLKRKITNFEREVKKFKKGESSLLGSKTDNEEEEQETVILSGTANASGSTMEE